MKLTQVSSTDIYVSSIGLGTVKFGRNQGVKYPNSFSLPTDKEISNLLSLAKDLNINLLDTAPAYGNSEERLGKLLFNRNDWVICTKVGENFSNGLSSFDFSKKGIQASIENSLKKINSDYLDIVLIHSNGDDEKIISSTDAFETLTKLKEQGLIKAIGMSTKTIKGSNLALKYSDVVMLTYNPIETSEKNNIDIAHQINKSIFVKKAFASGHLNKISNTNPIETSLDFINQQDGVTSIIVGTINKNHLREISELI
ncbi:aldo/keto reductase [Gammaproteobacteria bacterium]|nr:aldo/keto reductase [Gammaproteobacteria bacterium]